MKTTIDIPDKTFRRAKTLAAKKGIPLKRLLAEAIEDKISRSSEESDGEPPPWMKLYGEFAKSEDMRHETRRIQKLIDGEFERIEPEDWK
jgi:hypothetical protein